MKYNLQLKAQGPDFKRRVKKKKVPKRQVVISSHYQPAPNSAQHPTMQSSLPDDDTSHSPMPDYDISHCPPTEDDSSHCPPPENDRSRCPLPEDDSSYCPPVQIAASLVSPEITEQKVEHSYPNFERDKCFAIFVIQLFMDPMLTVSLSLFTTLLYLLKKR